MLIFVVKDLDKGEIRLTTDAGLAADAVVSGMVYGVEVDVKEWDTDKDNRFVVQRNGRAH